MTSVAARFFGLDADGTRDRKNVRLGFLSAYFSRLHADGMRDRKNVRPGFLSAYFSRLMRMACVIGKTCGLASCLRTFRV